MSSIPFGSPKGLTLDDDPFGVTKLPSRFAKVKLNELHTAFRTDQETYVYCGREYDECACNSDYACRCDRYVAYPDGRVVKYYWSGSKRRYRTVRKSHK